MERVTYYFGLSGDFVSEFNLSTLEMTANDIYQSLSFVFLIIRFWISTDQTAAQGHLFCWAKYKGVSSFSSHWLHSLQLYRLSLADPSTLWHKSPWCFLWWTQLCLLTLQTHHCIHTQLRQSPLYYTRAFQTFRELNACMNKTISSLRICHSTWAL